MKTKDYLGSLEHHINCGVPVVESLPEGWGVNKHAHAPNGYMWINNRQDVFSGLYKHALLKL